MMVDDGNGMLKNGGRWRVFMDVIVVDDYDVNGSRVHSVATRSGRNLTEAIQGATCIA